MAHQRDKRGAQNRSCITSLGQAHPQVPRPVDHNLWNPGFVTRPAANARRRPPSRRHRPRAAILEFSVSRAQMVGDRAGRGKVAGGGKQGWKGTPMARER